ncbi:GtrA family protein [Amylibacter sp. SFDW26]|uniref:GtrA family protein n=1 Tax=Amylibacter sp. SFDW26 TaxID=2652722 RepID=UPI00126207F8|nr:GtrA family protein [Amylibacter sp. SFDW26]KAB7613508.1 GtrA family protein [Amylibacter sp. SFDW26]
MINKAGLLQVLRFVTIGGGAAIIYFILALTLDRLFDLATIWASFLAFVFSAVFSFVGHRCFTFSPTQTSKKQMFRFMISTIIGLLLSTIIPILLQTQAPIVSYITVLITVPVVSFILLKFFVFSEV